MKHIILVVVETEDGPTNPNSSDGIQSEILSNLQSVEQEFAIRDASVTVLPDFVGDLKTLSISTQDATEPMECTAALANFTHDLLHLVGEDPHAFVFDEDGETNLDKFNLAHKARK